MIGGHTADEKGDRIAYATIHWNNASNTVNPVHHLAKGSQWITPNGSMSHKNSYIYWTLWNTTNIPNSINPVYAWTGYCPFYMILNIAIEGEIGQDHQIIQLFGHKKWLLIELEFIN
jgi:hypothetical protein